MTAAESIRPSKGSMRCHSNENRKAVTPMLLASWMSSLNLHGRRTRHGAAVVAAVRLCHVFR